MKKGFAHACLAILAAVSTAACGDRISIGELGGSSDGTEPGARPVLGGDPSSDGAGPPADGGGGAPGEDGGGAPDEDGGGAPDEDGGGAYDPCGGKVCGATCTICPPGKIGCVETAVLKQCNAAGTCSPSPPGC